MLQRGGRLLSSLTSVVAIAAAAAVDPDDDEDTINEEGILKFCEDIGVDPQDIVVLVIAWKMEAAYMCAFTRKEWQNGMEEMDCDSAAKLKAKIPQLREAIAGEDDFKKFYCFCFGFSKEPGQKSLSIDIAVAMWELLLPARFEKLTASWLAFLAEKKPVKGVTRDTWDLLLDFFVKVRESYANYDENEAWPVLIDDYMLWIDSKKNGVSYTNEPLSSRTRGRHHRPRRSSLGALSACLRQSRAPFAMEVATPAFLTPESLPERLFFPREYVAQYQRQLNELLRRVQRLLEEQDQLQVEAGAELEWDGVALAALPGHTVWQNLSALRDCGAILQDSAALLEHKIRESAQLDPDALELQRTQSSSSIPVSDYSSSDDVEETDDEQDAVFQDVEPVKGRKAAVALNNDVTERVQNALANEEEFETFKAHALQYGTASESADTFYGYLSREIPAPVLDLIVVDFARLLPQAALRVPLLKAHYEHMKNELARPSIAKFRNKSYSTAMTSRSSTSSSTCVLRGGGGILLKKVGILTGVVWLQASMKLAAAMRKAKNTLPRLRTFNHLVFVIHGIGQHIDFRDGEFKSWNGETGVEGGNHAFRDIFRAMLETTFQDIPLALEMQSIEWHEDLHEPTGLDNIFDLISPEGSSASPVGVMILARGDLDIKDGEFTPGIKIPNCRRYFNVYHPIDPIAYRIEPLIKQEMHDKEPVQLMQVLVVDAMISES
ncbi:unnamed protein product [Phytophthora lilii]|uniref:Defective in cullin neddylation protein n=1 Tax=Phytophthora lilii TaxID=2077276 RepID=A0A9W6TNL3_9STRA|nr:unnamed protein product [Phytophthora lilii]